MTNSSSSDSLCLSRRGFLGGTAAVGAAAIVGLDAKPLFAQDATPRRGGHLIVGIDNGSTGDTLDPARLTGRHIIVVGQQLYDTLVEVDAKLQVKPSLAESWEPNQNATEWVFKLRTAISFHNGKSLTAADVVYSLNRHRGEDSQSAAKSLVAPIRDIRANGDHEVVFYLESGLSDLPYILADYHLGIIPEDGDPLAGVGTGPFVLQEFQPGVRALTKRNANDWRSDRGYVDSVESLAINDATARISALQSGAAHLISRVDPKSAVAISKDAALQLFSVAGAGHSTLAMRTDVAPYNNGDLRLALKYAIDREAIVKTVLQGFGRVGNDQPVPDFDPFYNADLPQYAFDADKAAFHFKKAGLDAPITISVAESSAPGAVDALQLFQATAASAGITINIDRVPNDGYWDNVWMKKPFSIGAWSGRPTADLILSQVYKSDSNWNETFWKRPNFDKILLEARSELDPVRRKELYGDLQRQIHDDGGAIIPAFFNFLDAGTAKLRGFEHNPTYQLSGFRAPEKVWFAE